MQQVDQCLDTLNLEAIPERDQVVERFLEMRYVRQNFELEVPVTSELATESELEDVVAYFHRLHQQSYGHFDAEAPVEVVNVKARGVGRIPKPQPALLPSGGADPKGAMIGRRRVFFKAYNDWLECPHYDRVKLLRNNVIKGPAMVCEFDSSVTILPDHKAVVGSMGELVIETGKGEKS